MYHKITSLFLLAFFGLVGQAQQLVADTITVGGPSGQRNALLYLPADFSKSKTYPLVIYLHGMGQAGTDIDKLYQTGLPKVLKDGYRPTFDFIMVAPQSTTYSLKPQWLESILTNAKKRWAIDTNRIYLTGIDAGGWAAYGSQLNVSAAFATKIAAIATISSATQNIEIKNKGWWQASRTPLWAVAGERDKSYVSQNTALVNELNEKVPGLAAITVLPGVGHSGWNEVYTGKVTHEGKTIWDWLYQFDRSKTFSKPHAATMGASASGTDLPSMTASATTTGVGAYSGTHIEAEDFADRSGILTETTRDFAGGELNLFDVNQGDWVSYQINAPAAGSYTLNFRMACNAEGSRFQIRNGSGTVLTTVNVPNTNSWQAWRDVTAVINLAAGVQTLKLQSSSITSWRLNYFDIVKTPLNAFASYTLRPNSNTDIFLRYGLNLDHLKGGDTLNIPGGAYNVIELGAFRGTATNPLIIRNRGGQVTCKIIRLSNTTEYFKLLGNGHPGVTYGFKINGGGITGSCLTAFGKGFEIGYIEGMKSKSGFFIKKNPTADDPQSQFPNYEMNNIYIHHNYLHHITGEGMYIGHTGADGGQGGNSLLPVRMRNVEIAYNRVDQTSWDGIQLANATTGNKIHHNTITNFGTANIYGQQAGILLGSNSQADIYDNTIEYGTGNGIQNFGFGLNKIYNNTIVKVGRNGTDRGYEGVYCNDIIVKSESRPKQQIQANNNIIKYAMPWGAIRVSGYNKNSLPATMQYNKVLLPDAPSDWQKLYFPTYVPNSIISNNTLITELANGGDDDDGEDNGSGGISGDEPATTKRYLKVNIFSGTNPQTAHSWNNWNVGALASSDIKTTAIKYTDGAISDVKATLSSTGQVIDNGGNYGAGMAPAGVLRHASISTDKRTLKLSGLSASKTYSLLLYGSRRNRQHTTVYTINGVTKKIATGNNLSNKAYFKNLKADTKGQIVVTIDDLNNGYNYLNGFMLVEISTATK